MAHYFVGDIQGCFHELKALLDKVDFNPSKDELWAAGDLVARGPDSLKVLEFFLTLADAGKTVLGNHDLHLLAIFAGIRAPKPSDKLEPLLESNLVPAFREFLRHQPLMRELSHYHLVMSHAGVPPQWDLATLRQESRKVASALQQDDYLDALISKMYTQQAEQWSNKLEGIARLRYCINALTRMRYLHPDGALDFDCKKPVDEADVDLTPWFEFDSNLPDDYRIVFGHWAALMGQTGKANRIALDTGCCWGEYMTLWHLETDEKIIQPSLNLS